MSLRSKGSVLTFIFIAIACGTNLPELAGIDLEQWKTDKNGCKEVRARSITQLNDQKEKLKALNEMDIIKLLGRPDQNELYKRNQKFYYYFLEPGPPCQADSVHTKKLVIRFNAVGLAREVRIE